MTDSVQTTYTPEQLAAIPRLLLAIEDALATISDEFLGFDDNEEVVAVLQEVDETMRPFSDELHRAWEERQQNASRN